MGSTAKYWTFPIERMSDAGVRILTFTKKEEKKKESGGDKALPKQNKNLLKCCFEVKPLQWHLAKNLLRWQGSCSSGMWRNANCTVLNPHSYWEFVLTIYSFINICGVQETRDSKMLTFGRNNGLLELRFLNICKDWAFLLGLIIHIITTDFQGCCF